MSNAPNRSFRFTLAWALGGVTLVCVMLASYHYLGVDAIGLWWLIGVVACVVYGSMKQQSATAILGCGLVTFAAVLMSAPLFSPRHSQSAFSECKNYLRTVMLAVHLYEATWKKLPQQSTKLPNGERALSWRVSILPYLEEDLLYRSFRHAESWNSPTNSQFYDSMPPLYRCPLDDLGDKRHTSYVAITGHDTCWPSDTKISLDDLADGASNTMLLTEMHDSGIVWSEPRDLDAATIDWRINGKRRASPSTLHGPTIQHFDGSRSLVGSAQVHVAMADGSVRRLSSDTDPEVLKQLVNRRDGQPKEWPDP